MAGLIQDSNTNAIYGHSAAAVKKDGLKFSGRKPLGGVSNSANPFRKKASEKMVRKKNFAVIEDEGETRAKKKNISKASDTGRKVLHDISNSSRNQTTSRKTKLTEEPFHEKEIAYEEYDPHDHEACRKVQECKAMDMDDFLGLAHGCPKELPSLKRPETPTPSPPMRLLEDMLVQPFSRFASPDPSPPKSPDDDQFWKYWDENISLTLIDSPELVKH